MVACEVQEENFCFRLKMLREHFNNILNTMIWIHKSDEMKVKSSQRI